MVKNKLDKLIVILGPTGSGKTGLAVKLAKKFNGEIVSADSRQVYKGMDIGTAKPSKKEKRLVPHHLIDLIKPNQTFNAAVYKKLALKVIEDIESRDKIPFLVGGTGLYIKSIIDNINFPAVPAQKKIRKRMEKKTENELFKIYKKLDPDGAKFIDKNNKRRLIRAIEVCQVTKKPFWKQREKGQTLFNTLIIGIKLPEKELERRIKIRIEKMFKLGLEKEVKKLVKRYGWKISPLQTIGYQEWHEYFNKKTGRNEIKKQVILHTLQFSKRQMTWFKKDKRIKWIKNYKSAEKLVKETI